MGVGFSHSLCPLRQFEQEVSSMLLQLESRLQAEELGKKLNQVQLAFLLQLSRHSNSSLDGTRSNSWPSVHSPEMKHWRSLQFPRFGSSMKRNKIESVKKFILKLTQIEGQRRTKVFVGNASDVHICLIFYLWQFWHHFNFKQGETFWSGISRDEKKERQRDRVTE